MGMNTLQNKGAGLKGFKKGRISVILRDKQRKESDDLIKTEVDTRMAERLAVEQAARNTDEDVAARLRREEEEFAKRRREQEEYLAAQRRELEQQIAEQKARAQAAEEKRVADEKAAEAARAA